MSKLKLPIEQPSAGTEVADLRKAVEAIAVKPHAGKLTLLTRKLNNVLLAEAQKQGIATPTYRIPLSRLCANADYESSNLVLVKDQLRKMASTTVEWNVGAKGSRRWGVTSLIEVEIIEEGNRCWIEWGYPTKLKEKLLTPEIYSRMTLAMQNNFRSGAALALYEICGRYADSPGRLTMRMPWEEWRPTLTGVPDGEDGTYQEYKYFKRDVVKPAVAEINSLSMSDFEVELIEHKIGRSVADLQFKVSKKIQGGLNLEDPNIFDMSIVTRIVALGFAQAQAEKIYSDTDEAKLRAALDYTEKRLKQPPPIDSPQAYFRKALQAGYGMMAPGQAAGAKQKAIEMGKSPKPAAAPAQKPEQITEQLAKAWWDVQRLRAREEFDAKGADAQQADLVAFAESGALTPPLTKKWRADGLRNPMCAAAFLRWLLRDTIEPGAAELLQYGLANGLIATTAAAAPT